MSAYKGKTIGGKTANAVNMEQAFARAYVANGMNGKKAYKEIRPHVSDGFAQVGGSRMIAKDIVRKSIVDLLPSEEVEAQVIKEALAQQPNKLISWQEKHHYLTTSLKLKGYLNNNTGNNTVNIAIVRK